MRRGQRFKAVALDGLSRDPAAGLRFRSERITCEPHNHYDVMKKGQGIGTTVATQRLPLKPKVM